MTTANLQILEEMNCDPDKLNNFEFFADCLALWAAQYVPEIMAPIAKNAEELFDVAAIRILLGKWHDAYHKEREHERSIFSMVARGSLEDATPDVFTSFYKSEKNAYNTALYALIIA